MSRLTLFVLLLAVGMPCCANVFISVAPSSQIISLDSQASFGIDLSGLGNGTALGVYDINFGFDPTVLSYSSTTFESELDVLGLGDIQSVTPGLGTIELFELSLDSPSDLNSRQASSFQLATLTFDTLATGSNSPVTLSINALGDAYGNSIPATLQNGSVSIGSDVTVTPEPSTRLMALGGFLVLCLYNFYRMR